MVFLDIIIFKETLHSWWGWLELYFQTILSIMFVRKQGKSWHSFVHNIRQLMGPWRPLIDCNLRPPDVCSLSHICCSSVGLSKLLKCTQDSLAPNSHNNAHIFQHLRHSCWDSRKIYVIFYSRWLATMSRNMTEHKCTRLSNF